MSRLHAKAGVTCTVVENKSFLDVNPNKTPFSEVKFILLDPSVKSDVSKILRFNFGSALGLALSAG